MSSFRRAAVLLTACVVSLACDRPASTIATTETVVARAEWTVEVEQDPAVLELPDGTVVIAAQSRAQLTVLRPDGTDSTTVGRAGGAAGKFRLPVSLIPLSNTHFGVVDAGLRRVTVFDTQMAVKQLHPVPLDHDVETAVMLSNTRWLSEHRAGRVGDSVPLVESATDSIPARALSMLFSPATVFIDRGETGFNMAVEYLGRDTWGVTRDGDVWVARVRDNSVTWIRGNGVAEQLPPLDFEQIDTVDGDLRRWRGLPAPTSFSDFARPIAKRKAAFQHVVATETGELWYWLNQRDGFASELYRCRTRNNAWGNSMRLPYGSKLLRIGNHAAYAYQLSTAGEPRLAAYPVPACEGK